MTVVLLWIDRGARSQVATTGADGISQRQDRRQIGRMLIWLSASVVSASDRGRQSVKDLQRERVGDSDEKRRSEISSSEALGAASRRLRLPGHNRASRPNKYPTTSAPATVAMGRARIDVHTDSVSRVCTSMAWSGNELAQPAACVAAPAVLSTARCAVLLKRSTWAVVLSATVSTTLCAVCATFSIFRVGVGGCR
jgi:hypothetical protein